mgnify:CR=1 FL=1
MDAALVLSIASSTAISVAIGLSIIHRANQPDAETDRLAVKRKGAIIAYRVMEYRGGEYFSPVEQVRWHDGKLTASRPPSLINTHGIYCFKLADDPRIAEYLCRGRVLVKVALSGRVLEFQTGYRAGKAKILEVINV